MPWFKVDDGLATHPKAIAAGNTAMGLWLRAGSWCAAQLTDGRLPDAMLAPLGGRARDAGRLVAVGLWSRVDGGYQFKDWDQYQPTKVQVRADREASKERQRRHREQVRHGVTNAVTNAVTTPVTNAVSHTTPTRPDPKDSGLGSQSALGRSTTSPGDGLDLKRIARLLGVTDQAWVNRVIRQILERAPADVRDKQRYVEAAIRERPADYRPTPQAPRLSELCDHGRERATCPFEEKYGRERLHDTDGYLE